MNPVLCDHCDHYYGIFSAIRLLSWEFIFAPENRRIRRTRQSTWSYRGIFSPGVSPTHPTFAQNLMTSHLRRAPIGRVAEEGGRSSRVRIALLC